MTVELLRRQLFGRDLGPRGAARRLRAIGLRPGPDASTGARLGLGGLRPIGSWLVVAVLGAVAPALALTFPVNSTADEVDDLPGDGNCHTLAGTCTLRAAVMEANALAADVEIQLPAGNFVLSRNPTPPNGAGSGDLNLTASIGGYFVIVIRGAGASFTIIDADQLDRVFTIQDGRAAHLDGLTLQAGYAVYGGGIHNLGELSVSRCVIRGNTGQGYGGGIFNELTGDLSLVASAVRGNGASIGGGIANAGGEVYLYRTAIEDNIAREAGGVQSSGPLEIVGSSISGNLAFEELSGGGGGILNAALLFLTNSTVSSNRTNFSGGGVRNEVAGTIWTYNATIAFNEADADQDFVGIGGGVLNEAGGVVNLRNSVVAGNSLHAAPVYDDCRGAIGSYGRNKFWTIPAQCTVTQFLAGDFGLLGSLAELGPLRFNGGETRTHALVPPSDMIDGGEPIFGCVDRLGDANNWDQRSGYRSGAGVRCDIGAYEYEALPEGSLFSDDFESGNLFAW